jgi:hypothetical protein
MNKKLIATGVGGLLVGFVAGAASAWGLDPAEEPEAAPPSGDVYSAGAAEMSVFVEARLPDDEVAAIGRALRDDPSLERLDPGDDITWDKPRDLDD